MLLILLSFAIFTSIVSNNNRLSFPEGKITAVSLLSQEIKLIRERKVNLLDDKRTIGNIKVERIFSIYQYANNFVVCNISIYAHNDEKILEHVFLLEL